MSEQSQTLSATPRAYARDLPRERLGDIVVNLGFCDREAVESAVAAAAATGELLGQTLLERGAVTTDQLAIAMPNRLAIAIAS